MYNQHNVQLTIFVLFKHFFSDVLYYYGYCELYIKESININKNKSCYLVS